MLSLVVKNDEFYPFFSVVAAATENYDDCKNDNPGAVIVKKMAKAVVIHSMFLRRMFAMLSRLVYNMKKTVEVTLMKIKKEKIKEHLKRLDFLLERLFSVTPK